MASSALEPAQEKEIDPPLAKQMEPPQEGETRSQFMGRCMGHDDMMSEHPDGHERLQACSAIWAEARAATVAAKEFGSSKVADYGQRHSVRLS